MSRGKVTEGHDPNGAQHCRACPRDDNGHLILSEIPNNHPNGRNSYGETATEEFDRARRGKTSTLRRSGYN